MQILSIVLLLGVLIAVGVVLYLRWRQSRGICANCGSSSHFGYSSEPESKAEDIVKLCFRCLAAKLTDDYQRYEGKALAIQPAAGFPCYVFQPKSRWADSKFAKEMAEMFSKTDETCNQCGSNVHFLWLTSNGLNPSNFEQVLSNGLSETLMRWGNLRPISLCGGCCVKLITKAIEDHGLSFYEVCSPLSGDGFVMPMGY
jgi:hypothetical protein